MKLIKLTLLTFALSLIMISCSEDNTPTTNNNGDDTSYFSMDAGSYWLNENYDIDQNEDRINDTYYYDSTVVASKTQYDGKESYKLEKYVDGQLEKTNYFAESDNEVFIRADFLIPTSFSDYFTPDVLPEGWLTLVNKNQNSWEISPEITVENVDFGLLTSDVKLSVSGSKDGTETIQINNTSYTADKIKVTTKLELIDLSIEKNIYTYVYLVKDFGLLKLYTEPFSIGLGFVSKDFDGFESTAFYVSMQ